MPGAKAQQEIQRLQQELAQARSALDEFTASVSHDLRAPLRHINAYVRIIQEDFAPHAEQLPQGLQSHLEVIGSAAKLLTRQIDALVSLSRLGRAELQLTRLDVGGVIQQVREALTPTLPPSQAARQGARQVNWQLPASFVPLLCDASLLRQALTHVLGNALKFSASRAVADISVSWQMHKLADGRPGCAIAVKDNGVGFDPQFSGRLFQTFSKLHPEREFDGLGMGLALTRKIVERHGGTVWAQASVNGGCTLFMSWPVVEI